MSRLVWVEGRPYAVGLVWRQLRGAQVTQAKECLKLAREQGKKYPGHTHVALRQEEFGLATLPAGLGAWPGGTSSLAASLRPDTGKKAFLGVFPLMDDAGPFWWVCSLYDGLVTPNSDTVFATEGEAKKAARDLRQLLPKDSLSEARFKTVAESLAFLKTPRADEPPLVPLQKKELKGFRLKAAVAGAILLALFGLRLAVGAYVDSRDTRARAAAKSSQEALRQDVLGHPYKYFQAGWLKAPSVVEAGAQCAAAILAQPLVDAGWGFESATCLPGKTLSVKRRFAPGASYLNLPQGASIKGQREAVGSQPLAKLAPRPRPKAKPLPTKAQAEAGMYELARQFGCAMSLPKWEEPERHVMDKNVALPAPWARGVVKLSGLKAAAMLSPEIFEALAGQPAFTLSSVTRSLDRFDVEGIVYGLIGSQKVFNVPSR